MRFLSARQISLVITSSFFRLSENQVEFLGKTSLRLSELGCKKTVFVLRRIESWVRTTEPYGQRLIREGNLSAGINWFCTQPVWYRFLHSLKIKSAKDSLLFFQEGVRLSESREKSLAPRARGEAHRVLFLLTNSFPYTQSGYTIRSHNTLQALALVGIVPIAFTRIGYPALVGKRISRAKVTVDGISYRQLIPWAVSPNPQKRIHATAKMVLRELNGATPQAIVATTDFKNALVARDIAVDLGVPWIYEVRGELESTWAARQELAGNIDARKSELFSLLRRQEVAAMNAADRVVVLSKVYKDRLVDRGISEEKIEIIPNGVTEDDFLLFAEEAQALRQRYSIPNRPTIGTVTSVVGYEGLCLLVGAVAQIPEIHCVIVGDGDELERLREEADRLEVANRITFVGRVPVSEVNHWYSLLDLFVIPRLDVEVCRVVTPLKPLQAMAKGIPVVGSNLPALREITGGLMRSFRPGDTADFANAIRLELDSPHSKEDLIQWAKSHTWRMNAKKYETLINEISNPE